MKTQVMRNESLPLQIDGKSRKFSRSWMTTWITPLISSQGIWVRRQISLNSETTKILRI